ncbi:MAG: prephenate dehydratase [Thermacetogeniaceae bacterium]
MRRIGYLGPKGTFSEEAALVYSGGNAVELVACPSVEAVLKGVIDGTFEEGIVPVENSTEGAVGVVLDMLAGCLELYVRCEVVLPVLHCLMAGYGVELGQVEKVISHPQALAQCRQFLNRHLPGVAQEEAPSTAAAASMVAASSRPWAALGCARSADEFGLNVLVPVANDFSGNVTRFWVLGKEQRSLENNDEALKTSIIFEVEHRPGALYTVLGEFAWRGINLTRIESRPAKRRLGDYLFFLDFCGSQKQPRVRDALKGVAKKVLNLKILGSYPVIDCTADGSANYPGM